MSELKDLLFKDDEEKLAEAVEKHAFGSYQLGEVARISSLLYDRGIDVEKHLIQLCKQHRIKYK